MNHSARLSVLLSLSLLLVAIVPVAAETSTITAISPSVGYLGSSTTVTITGTDFNESSVKVRLMMVDESNISATITSHTATEIVCRFTLSSSKTTGDWDLVVINEVDSEAIEVEGFSIREAISLSSISPAEGQANNESVDFTLEGSGLADIESLYLYNEDYSNITATLDDVDTDTVTGTFDLTDATEGTYDVCVMDSTGTTKCALSFDVTTDQVGSLDISSSPTGASVYIDGEYFGTTPYTADDLVIGSHKLLLEKSGYEEWGKIVRVTAGGTTTVDADLTAVVTATTTVPTTVSTPVPVATTVKATAVKTSAVTVPTTWPGTTTTTQASPLDPAVLITAAGIGFLALRRP
jgi:hypothetical protein